MSKLALFFAIAFVVLVVGLVTAFSLVALLLNGSAIVLGVPPFHICVAVAIVLALVVAGFATVDRANRSRA
jgi:hypothetical protein